MVFLYPRPELPRDLPSQNLAAGGAPWRTTEHLLVLSGARSMLDALQKTAVIHPALGTGDQSVRRTEESYRGAALNSMLAQTDGDTNRGVRPAATNRTGRSRSASSSQPTRE